MLITINMKKVFVLILIVAAMITVTSCGTAVKVGHGVGVGYSLNEQTAKDKALANAFTDRCFSDEARVNASITTTVEDVNGKPSETTTTTKTLTTQGTYTQNSKKFIVGRNSQGYTASAEITGKRAK